MSDNSLTYPGRDFLSCQWNDAIDDLRRLVLVTSDRVG